MSATRTAAAMGIVSILILVGLLSAGSASADSGVISVEVVVEIPIYEPGQKAIICWDGTEEILVLGTDVSAAKNTLALQIVPLPSMPTIRKCNNSIFLQMRDLTTEVIYRDEGKDAAGTLGTDAGEEEEEIDVEVVFHTTMGVHNLTVITAKTGAGWADWVNDYLTDLGLDPIDNAEAEAVAGSYIDRGIEYFVLDLLELGPQVQSSEPLMYTFESDSLFYPMEISSLTGGESHILLFILTPHEVIEERHREEDRGVLGKTVKDVRKDRYVKLDGKDSPFDFELIHEIEITLDEIRRQAERYTWNYEDEWYEYRRDTGNWTGDDDYYYSHYSYSSTYTPNLTDIWQIHEFFNATRNDEIKACVYEYDGTLDLKGDVDVAEFSTLNVVFSEEYIISYGRFFALLILPLFTVAGVLVMYHFTTRKRPMEQEPPRASAIPPPTQGPPPRARPPPGPGGPPPAF